LRNNKGFLLLEVMLAMVMVTSGLLFVGRVYSAAKGAMDRSRDLFASSLLLEEKMFDLQLPVAQYGADRGGFPDNKGCYWEVRASALSEEPPELFKIILGVFLPSGKDSPDTYRLETYLIKNRSEESE